MIEAQFEYKCRRCGAIVRNPCCSVDMAELILTVCSRCGSSAEYGHVHMRGIHGCDDGASGVTDLIGYRIFDTGGPAEDSPKK